MAFSPQQEAALARVNEWLETGEEPIFRLFGFAGTGKTTLAKYFAENVKGHVQYGAFTGKACQVLRNKGCLNAATLHSMMYKADTDLKGHTKFKLNLYESILRFSKLVILDEVSMIGPELGRDLMKFGKKVLVLGDPAQLPPVKAGDGYFMKGEHLPSDKPEVMLTEVHRQAAENPIIRLSMDIREGRGLKNIPKDDERLVLTDYPTVAMGKAADQIICGTNRSRDTKNRRMRGLLGFEGTFPTAGERLICLRNNSTNGLFNGQMWQVSEIGEKKGYRDEEGNNLPDHLELHATSLDDSGIVSTRVMREMFEGGYDKVDWRMKRNFDEFDFGYCITCHKAQGSQWDNVLLFDESRAFSGDAQAWLYTAVTRAAEKLTIVR